MLSNGFGLIGSTRYDLRGYITETYGGICRDNVDTPDQCTSCLEFYHKYTGKWQLETQYEHNGRKIWYLSNELNFFLILINLILLNILS